MSASIGTAQPSPRRSGKIPNATSPIDQAAHIAQSFNTWSFKREQPDTLVTLQERIARAVAASKLVEFVMYWGKGPRNQVAAPEAQTMSYLASMMARIATCYAQGTHVTLILTDTHARLNGHSDQAMAEYFAGVRKLAAEHGFATSLLSRSVAQHGSEIVDNACAPSPELLRALTHSAAKWHFGGLSAEAAARSYFAQNMIERAAVELAHPDAIFLTYNGSEQRALFPAAMPVFYMYALKRGVAVKPWFMNVA